MTTLQKQRWYELYRIMNGTMSYNDFEKTAIPYFKSRAKTRQMSGIIMLQGKAYTNPKITYPVWSFTNPHHPEYMRLDWMTPAMNSITQAEARGGI